MNFLLSLAHKRTLSRVSDFPHAWIFRRGERNIRNYGKVCKSFPFKIIYLFFKLFGSSVLCSVASLATVYRMSRNAIDIRHFRVATARRAIFTTPREIAGIVPPAAIIRRLRDDEIITWTIYNYGTLLSARCGEAVFSDIERRHCSLRSSFAELSGKLK